MADRLQPLQAKLELPEHAGSDARDPQVDPRLAAILAYRNYATTLHFVVLNDHDLRQTPILLQCLEWRMHIFRHLFCCVEKSLFINAEFFRSIPHQARLLLPA
jgi:hypothetical protein